MIQWTFYRILGTHSIRLFIQQRNIDRLFTLRAFELTVHFIETSITPRLSPPNCARIFWSLLFFHYLSFCSESGMHILFSAPFTHTFLFIYLSIFLSFLPHSSSTFHTLVSPLSFFSFIVHLNRVWSFLFGKHGHKTTQLHS